MGIFDRIILTIYTILLAFLSLGVILISLQLVSLEQVRTSIFLIYGHWEAGLVAGVFLLVSVRLLLPGCGQGGAVARSSITTRWATSTSPSKRWKIWSKRRPGTCGA
jgi:hypothetical protein